MIDDNPLAHEPEESTGVGSRVTSRDLITITEVDPDLEKVFSLLLEVISLQIVDDREVVDVASISRYVPVTAWLSKLVELVQKRTCQRNVNYIQIRYYLPSVIDTAESKAPLLPIDSEVFLRCT